MSGATKRGLSSTIDPETFERHSISIVATVDVSGSMGWSYGDQGTPAAITRDLLKRIAAELGPQDRFSLVTYGSNVTTPLSWVNGDDAAIDAAIDALDERGSTNMEEGLKTAYDLASQASGTDEVRVMLFTDVQPNVGATTASSFSQLAQQGADDGTGLTVFGVGLGLGAEIMKAMSELRGGNAFSLPGKDDPVSLMQDSWPWMVSPIAYDLSLRVTPSDNLTVANGYGFPGDDGTMNVASVFLSRRKGALLLELSPAEALQAASAEVELSYETLQGEPISLSLSAAYDGQPGDERGIFMSQPSVDKTVALALLTQGLHDASELYAASPDEAIARLEVALERFERDAAALKDEAIDAELAFWPKLLELMKDGAPQGSLYGG